MTAIKRATADGYRIDRADLSTVVHDELASLPPAQQQAVRVTKSAAYNEEAAALAHLDALTANGWIFGNREAEVAALADAKAAQAAADEQWIAARAAELEAEDDRTRRESFVLRAKAELARARDGRPS